ncbi:MAG: hypothetical protein AAF430_01185 [Myxococcota bacterium]
MRGRIEGAPRRSLQKHLGWTLGALALSWFAAGAAQADHAASSVVVTHAVYGGDLHYADGYGDWFIEPQLVHYKKRHRHYRNHRKFRRGHHRYHRGFYNRHGRHYRDHRYFGPGYGHRGKWWKHKRRGHGYYYDDHPRFRHRVGDGHRERRHRRYRSHDW